MKIILIVAIVLCVMDDQKDISYEEFKRQKNEWHSDKLLKNTTTMEDIIRITKSGQDRLDSLTAIMQLKLELEKVESGYYEWLLENKETK